MATRGNRKQQPRLDAIAMVGRLNGADIQPAEPCDPLSLAALAVYLETKRIITTVSDHPGLAFVSLMGQGRSMQLDTVGSDVEITYQLPLIAAAA